jgi:hypothetical protein
MEAGVAQTGAHHRANPIVAAEKIQQPLYSNCMAAPGWAQPGFKQNLPRALGSRNSVWRVRRFKVGNAADKPNHGDNDDNSALCGGSVNREIQGKVKIFPTQKRPQQRQLPPRW